PTLNIRIDRRPDADDAEPDPDWIERSGSHRILWNRHWWQRRPTGRTDTVQLLYSLVEPHVVQATKPVWWLRALHAETRLSPRATRWHPRIRSRRNAAPRVVSPGM